jgi:translation elongation factor EF-4
VLNKMDLPSANPEEVKDQIVDLLGCKREEILSASGKTGLGVDKVLEEIVASRPSAEGRPCRTLASAHLRQRLQPIPRHHRLLPRDERHHPRKAIR